MGIITWRFSYVFMYFIQLDVSVDEMSEEVMDVDVMCVDVSNVDSKYKVMC